VAIEGAATAEWLGVYQALSGPADTSAVAERVLARVPAPAAFARVAVDGAGVAIGLFVAGVQWAGVFCMATDPRYRRRGLARVVLGAGARWALGRGCRRLYLQVEQDNIAARDLYARTGFAHSHSYHYRVADTTSGGHCTASTPALGQWRI
jgi:GNAT superfamily N-acetyltransferase